MSIDFSRVTEMSDKYGVITQLELGGRVIWQLPSGGKVVLQVEKITSDTYAGETTYTGEEFILLDIYPKTNGAVKVTYGGLTKTITDTSGAEEPNAQQVYFGTFNGVSDSVTTPASGELVIDGDFYAFGCGSFKTGSKDTNVGYFGGITTVSDFGSMTDIAAYTFRNCDKLVCQELPEGITTIGDYAFAMKATTSNYGSSSINSLSIKTAMLDGEITLPSTIKSIGSYAFASPSAVAYSSGATADRYPGYLSKVKILATTPPTLGELSFGGSRWTTDGKYTYTTIEVLKGCGDTYKVADGWSNCAGQITEAE